MEGLSSGVLSQTETLSALFADGLSREGSARVFNTNGPLSSWTIKDYNKTADFTDQLLKGGNPLEKPTVIDLTVERAAISITGYSYKASALTDYLSISILLIHILLALCHIIEMLITRQSSSCWDTVTELLALMQNSRPAPTALKNTCAGIMELGTFGKLAIIRATRPGSSISLKQSLHVEVLYREEEEESIEMQKLLGDSRSVGNSASSAPKPRDSLCIRLVSPSRSDHGRSHSCHGSTLNGDDPFVTDSESTLERVQPNELYGQPSRMLHRRRSM
ncbi:MAG: hypothetical protein MMC33_003146 [Icmadophila ericetorum]|nr:hypothetical protein [Icmadophila ericetorum]